MRSRASRTARDDNLNFPAWADEPGSEPAGETDDDAAQHRRPETGSEKEFFYSLNVELRGCALLRQSRLSAGLDRGIPERPQYSIDFGLVARTLRLEPLKDISIQPKRN